RHSHHQLAVWHHRARREYRAGGDDAAAADLAVIQHDRADADERPRTHATAVHHRAVADADIVGDIQIDTGLRVNDRAVLNVHAAPDANRRDIAADHDVMHDGAIVAEGHLAADVGSRRDIDVAADGRRDHAMGVVIH